jgi:hypothetical protein
MNAARPPALNRKQRKELARRLRVDDPGLEVMHPHAAGIDVGNSAHYVAVRPDRDPNSVRRFECFTADLHRLADWLQHCGVNGGDAVDRRLLDCVVRDPRHSGL